MTWWWRLVRFGFRLLYNELAFTYDLVSKVVSLGQWRCWQRTALRHLHPPADAPVLELAHGTGDLQVDLRNAGYATVGYDLSANMGRIAHRKLGPQAKLVRGAAQTLPFANAMFPAVVCTFPTPFITEAASLREAWRVLQPGGQLILVLSGALTGRGPTERAIEWLYAVTGQRGGNSEASGFLGALRGVGFEARVVEEGCPGSAVLLVVAEKLV